MVLFGTVPLLVFSAKATVFMLIMCVFLLCQKNEPILLGRKNDHFLLGRAVCQVGESFWCAPASDF